jgi:hypothetical protein
VLLDGRAWADRLTVRDRDGLPEEVLSHLLHWPQVRRVWLPDWLDNRDAVVDRLVEAVHGDAPEPVPTTPATEFAPAPQPIESVAPPAFLPWQPIEAGAVQVLDQLPAPAAAATVAGVIADVVTAEGPIHVDRLVKLVAGAFGLTRVAESRRVAILRHVPTELRQDDYEPVVWPTSLDPETWNGFRATPPDVDRPLEHVALREIVNAMVDAARAAAGMQVPELRRQVLGVFGGKRLTNNISERLNNALELGTKQNLLTIDAGGTVTA